MLKGKKLSKRKIKKSTRKNLSVVKPSRKLKVDINKEKNHNTVNYIESNHTNKSGLGQANNFDMQNNDVMQELQVLPHDITHAKSKPISSCICICRILSIQYSTGSSIVIIFIHGQTN